MVILDLRVYHDSWLWEFADDRTEIARVIADITIAAYDLHDIVKLLSDLLMKCIKWNLYLFVI